MKTNNLFLNIMLVLSVVFVTSCSKDDTTGETPKNQEPEKRTFHVSGVIKEGEVSSAYLAGVQDLSQGDLTFKDNGLKLNATRAARVLTSGDYVYALDYGGGIIYQYKVKADGTYEAVKQLDVSTAMGTATPRFKQVSDDAILVQNVVVETVKDGETITSVTPTMYAAIVKIPELQITTIMDPYVIAQTDQEKPDDIYTLRVDAPVVQGGKVYYGMMRTVNGIGFGGTPASTGVQTLVMDYPSLTNQTVIRSESAVGHTNGYRTPSMHVDEKGDVYQSNQFMARFKFDLSGGSKTVIKKLKDGNYDESYVFNVSEALGEEISTAGWFYVGNGIGYMPILLEDVYDPADKSVKNYWSVAKIDVYNKTATKIDVPLSDLLSYQSGVVHDGKFYMAISPVGGDAKVYEFDPATNTAKAALDLKDENVFVQGLY